MAGLTEIVRLAREIRAGHEEQHMPQTLTPNWKRRYSPISSQADSNPLSE